MALFSELLVLVFQLSDTIWKPLSPCGTAPLSHSHNLHPDSAQSSSGPSVSNMRPLCLLLLLALFPLFSGSEAKKQNKGRGLKGSRHKLSRYSGFFIYGFEKHCRQVLDHTVLVSLSSYTTAERRKHVFVFLIVHI